MEQQEKTRTSYLPIYLVLAILGVGGYYLSQHPYQTVRPQQPSSMERPIVSSEHVEARLWQDPLRPVLEENAERVCRGEAEALSRVQVQELGQLALAASVATGETTQQESEERVQTLLDEIEHPPLTVHRQAHRLHQLAFEVRVALDHPGGWKETQRKPGSLMLLPVMVRGGSGADASEQRRRTRHAVLSGLGTSGFVPQEADHLGYVETCWDARGRLSGTDRGQPLRVPYEWFRRSDEERWRGTPTDVLLLWIDESLFADRPLTRMNDLLRHLAGYCYFDERNACPAAEEVTYRLVGPAASETLRALLREEPSSKSDWWDIELGSAEALSALLAIARIYLDEPELLVPSDTREAITFRQNLGSAVESAGTNLQGIESVNRREISQILKAVAPVEEVLKKRDIADSDPNWYQTVAGVWGLWYLEEQMQSPVDQISRPAQSNVSDHDDGEDQEESASSATRMLVEFARFYLDDPERLPPDVETRLDKSVEDATRILNSLPEEPATNEVVEAVEPVRAALEKLEIQDSDPEWFATVAGSWGLWYLEEGRGAAQESQAVELERSPEEEAEIPGVEAVSESAQPDEANRRRSSWASEYRTNGYRDARNRTSVVSSYWVHWLGRAAELNLEPRLEWAGGFRDFREEDSILPFLSIYASRPTAPWNLLERRGGGEPVLPDRSFDQLASFVRVTSSDDLLAAALLDELDRRRLDLCNSEGNDRLVLIGEWDSFYSRSITTAFRTAMRDCGGEPSAERLVSRHYLRGLDGSTPISDGGAGGGEDPERDSAGRYGSSLGRSLERPEGPRRHDYLRRLAADLMDLDERLRLGGQGRIRAIGVVGSDVYDKLLVLQALRRQFPRTLFFTTDLDAALMHPADYGWNRNLLVASSYGLTLHEDLQASIPPFRGSYQTATYLAVLLALGGPAVPGSTPLGPAYPDGPGPVVQASTAGAAQPVMRPSHPRQGAEPSDGPLSRAAEVLMDGVGPPPRIFELGRHGARDLTVYEVKPRWDVETREAAGYTTREATGQVGVPRSWPFHPERPEQVPRLVAAAGSSLLFLFGICLLVPVLPAVRRFTLGRARPEIRPRVRLVDAGVIATAAGLALLLYLVIADHLDPAGEPVAWVQGVSSWPTIGLYALGAVLAFGLLGLARIQLTRSDRVLARDYGFRTPDARRSVWMRWARIRRRNGTATWGEGWRGVAARLRAEVATWWKARCSMGLTDWALDDERADDVPRHERGERSAGRLWRRYQYCGRFGHRLARTLPSIAVYVAAGALLVFGVTGLHLPLRGGRAVWTYGVVVTVALLGLIILTFFVVDAIRLCRRFVHGLVSSPTRWPTEALRRVCRERKLAADDARWFFDAQMIADRTEAVGRLIVYPFVVLFVILVARSGLFDNWDWPWSLILVFGVVAVYALWSAIALRREAEAARRQILSALREQEVEQAGSYLTDGRRRQIRLLAEDIERLDRGAFASISHHPVVKATLLPFGGLGAAFLLELLGGLGL